MDGLTEEKTFLFYAVGNTIQPIGYSIIHIFQDHSVYMGISTIMDLITGSSDISHTIIDRYVDLNLRVWVYMNHSSEEDSYLGEEMG